MSRKIGPEQQTARRQLPSRIRRRIKVPPCLSNVVEDPRQEDDSRFARAQPRSSAITHMGPPPTSMVSNGVR